jgi:RND family efflux transporter MFP subunit
MKRSLLFVTVIAWVFFIYGCTQPKAKETTATTEKEYPVKVATIKKEMINRTLNYTANLSAFEEVYFAPATPGRIDDIFVDIGDRVSKGQVIIEMDRTQLKQAEIQLQNARSNFKRLDTLYQLESISEQNYEQVKTQYEVAQSNVEFLKENTSLKSPIDGIVTGRYYEPQEMYSGAPNTPAGKAAVVTLMQINPLKAFIDISERYYPEIKKGMNATIQTDMYKNKAFTGSVYRVHPTMDQSTRTFKTEITVDNPGETLRPGMFARVNINLERDEALVVPAIAVLQQEGTNIRYVFINNSGIAKRLNVEMGERFDENLEVISDELKEGMELIVAGQANLTNGAKLKVSAD